MAEFTVLQVVIDDFVASVQQFLQVRFDHNEISGDQAATKHDDVSPLPLKQ